MQIQVIMHFSFHNLRLKLWRLVSLKMVTNMYRVLRTKCASNIRELVSTEIPVWRAILPGINTFPNNTLPRQIWRNVSRFLRSQITCSYVLCCVRLFIIPSHDKYTWVCHTENSSVYINFKKYGPSISVVNTRNMSNTVIDRHVN